MPSNLSPAVTALVASLLHDPFYQAITRDFAEEPARREEVLGRYFAYSLSEGARMGRCILAREPGLGAAVWILPRDESTQAAEASAKAAYLREILGPIGHENYKRIVGFMKPRSEALLPDAAWYLSIVGVAPAAQGKGIGAELLAPTLAEADKEGSVCFLETFTPRNLRFYERIGFQRFASHLEPVTGSEYVIMRRTPNHALQPPRAVGSL